MRLPPSLILPLLLMASTSHAANYQWLKNSPAASFTKGDWESISRAVSAILERDDNDQPIAWSNAESGHAGTVEVIATGKREGQSCRVLEIVNTTRKNSNRTRQTFCRQPGGDWLITTGSHHPTPR